ncbi:MAG: DUF6702 family protein [Cellulophaga sp.]
MHIIRKGILFLVLPLFAFTVAHKFYVSVTNINYSKEDKALQITSRIFIDDFEMVLQERYGIEANLGTKEEATIADEYIEKYLKSKFIFKIDGEYKTFTFIGKKYDNDIMICYLELSKVELEKIKTIEFQNEILTDMYEEQQNIIHFKLNGKKKSFILIKESNKGMLKL